MSSPSGDIHVFAADHTSAASYAEPLNIQVIRLIDYVPTYHYQPYYIGKAAKVTIKFYTTLKYRLGTYLSHHFKCLPTY